MQARQEGADLEGVVEVADPRVGQRGNGHQRALVPEELGGEVVLEVGEVVRDRHPLQCVIAGVVPQRLQLAGGLGSLTGLALRDRRHDLVHVQNVGGTTDTHLFLRHL